MAKGRFWVKQAKRTAYDGPPRAAILCRQSLTKKESISLEDQEIRNRSYAEREGYEVVDVRHSPNVKGWKDDREDHDHFRELAKSGEIDVVISYDVMRAARTMRIMEMFAHDLETLGCRMEFSSQPMANSATGRQMITMLAEMETVNRSVKLTDAWDTLRRRGQWHGKAPYGFRRANKTIIPDETEIDTARRILALALSGTGSVAIRDLFDAEGVPTRTGARWDEIMISRMLRNPAYAGGMVIDGEPCFPPEGVIWHEPVICREEWERLQSILVTRRTTRRKPVSSWTEELVYHECGERMYLIATESPRKDLIALYRCRMRHKLARCRLPHSEVSARNLEKAARTAILASLAGIRDPAEVVREHIDRQKASGTISERRAILKERSAVIAERARAENLHLKGRRPEAWFNEQDDGFKARLAALDEREAALDRPVDIMGIRAIGEHLALVARVISAASDHAIALALRELGARLIVGDGGVRISFPPDYAELLRPQPPLKIPRARTR